MKYFVKTCGLVLIGLVVAVIIYPFLHELGHGIMGILAGGRVTEFTLWPLPSILTVTQAERAETLWLVGWGGMLLPALVSSLLWPRRFCVWYGVLVLRLICLWSFVLSVISCFCFAAGHPLPQDDMTTLLSLFPNGMSVSLLMASAGTGWMFFLIFHSHITMHCNSYFCISTHAQVFDRNR